MSGNTAWHGWSSYNIKNKFVHNAINPELTRQAAMTMVVHVLAKNQSAIVYSNLVKQSASCCKPLKVIPSPSMQLQTITTDAQHR